MTARVLEGMLPISVRQRAFARSIAELLPDGSTLLIEKHLNAEQMIGLTYRVPDQPDDASALPAFIVSALFIEDTGREGEENIARLLMDRGERLLELLRDGRLNARTR